jgi:hypothetical protein
LPGQKAKNNQGWKRDKGSFREISFVLFVFTFGKNQENKKSKFMIRIILGVVTGFIVWSFVWIGADALLAALSPDWFGKNLVDFQNAVDRKEAYTPPSTVTICMIFLSVLCSLAAGFVAVWLGRERVKTTFILSVLLLATGIFVEAANWKFLPLWYHFLFLLMLVPMTILGGKLKAINPRRPVLRS